MKILVFIPARGGSKGILGKNLVKVNDKPLIKYTLETSVMLQQYNEYSWIPFVSTDDIKISDYCSLNGMEMSYLRPKKLGKDNSIIIDAVWDSLKWLEDKKSIIPDAVLLLQPTSPIRNTNEIIKTIKKVDKKSDFSIVGVTKMYEHPYECIEVHNGSWKYLRKTKKELKGRQDYLSNFYFISGSFYFASVEFLKKNKSFVIEDKTDFFVLKERWSVDIDEKEDLIVASALLKESQA